MCWLLRSQRACFRFTSCARMNSNLLKPACLQDETNENSLHYSMTLEAVCPSAGPRLRCRGYARHFRRALFGQACKRAFRLCANVCSRSWCAGTLCRVYRGTVAGHSSSRPRDAPSGCAQTCAPVPGAPARCAGCIRGQLPGTRQAGPATRLQVGHERVLQQLVRRHALQRDLRHHAQRAQAHARQLKEARVRLRAQPQRALPQASQPLRTL